MDEAQYVCWKGYHSINVQAVCDHKCKFIHMSAKWLGSTNDSFILRVSKLWTAFERGDFNGILLGDSAYPFCKWLMTSFFEINWHITHLYAKLEFLLNKLLGG